VTKKKRPYDEEHNLGKGLLYFGLSTWFMIRAVVSRLLTHPQPAGKTQVRLLILWLV